MYKTFGILGLFLLLVIILIINPRVIHSAYNNILGRIILIGIIIFFSMNNVTLGLLAALCLIIASDMFLTYGSLIEGLENNTTSATTTADTTTADTTIADTSTADTGPLSSKQIQIISKAQQKIQDSGAVIDGSTINELKAEAETQGVDRQTIEESIKSKSSNTLPINNLSSSENVSPNDSTKEGFGSQY